jgi:hypothetical protein
MKRGSEWGVRQRERERRKKPKKMEAGDNFPKFD